MCLGFIERQDILRSLDYGAFDPTREAPDYNLVLLAVKWRKLLTVKRFQELTHPVRQLD